LTLPPAIPEPLDRILPQLIDDLRAGLGEDFVGAYLYGSAISGGFDPAISDLDVVVVTARPTADIDFEAFDGIVRGLQAREPEWAHRLDITFVGKSTLATFQDGGTFVEISHDDPLERKPDAAEWLQTWFLAREADATLTGPPVRSVIPDIGLGAFLSAIEENVDARVRDALVADRPGAIAFLILTLCRTGRTLAERATCTKVEGAAWAVERLPGWRWLIEAALDVRAGDGARAFSAAELAAIPALISDLAGLAGATRSPD
jgi:hypothetical protein